MRPDRNDPRRCGSDAMTTAEFCEFYGADLPLLTLEQEEQVRRETAAEVEALKREVAEFLGMETTANG